MEMLGEWWRDIEGRGEGYGFMWKLKKIKHRLKVGNRDVFGNLNQRRWRMEIEEKISILDEMEALREEGRWAPEHGAREGL